MRRWILKALCMVGLVALAGCSDDSSEDPCAGANPAPSCTANNVNNTNNVNNSNNSNNSNNVNNVNNVACDPMCSGETPVCDEGTCVECAGNDDCADGICNANGACVACVESTDCPAEAPICFGAGESAACIECAGNNDCTDGVCDTTNNVCVGCFGDGDCANDEVCNMDNNVCVGCVEDGDCTDPMMAKCDTATNACVSCDDSAQCVGIGDTETCNTANGSCVECLPASEAADCSGNACDPSTLECTQIGLDSGMGCDPCVGDSSCATDFACLAIDYKGSPAGSFCFELRPMGMQCSPVTYGTPLENRTSLGGITGDFCGINESLTTCGAVKNVGTTCGTDDSICEVEGADGVCVLDACTTPCSRDRECSAGCNTQAGYCS